MAQNDEELKFTVLTDNGEEVECEVLFTFDSDETNKSYMVYTDNTMDTEGNTRVYASSYDSSGGFASLQPIENDKEWRIIETILNTLQEELTKKDESKENIWLGLSEMEKRIDSIEESDENALSICFSQIVDMLMDEELIEYTEPIFSLYKKVQKKFMLNYVSSADIGMKAYQQKNFQLAELAFTDAEANNNLAYLIRRGEVKDCSKYSKKTVAELLKEGVHEREPFSMVNMSLFWALNVGGDEAWKLADYIMSNVPVDNLLGVYEWWLEVGKSGDIEGYLVHYWLLKYGRINVSPLGTRREIRKHVQSFVKEIPMCI